MILVRNRTELGRRKVRCDKVVSDGFPFLQIFDVLVVFGNIENVGVWVSRELLFK